MRHFVLVLKVTGHNHTANAYIDLAMMVPRTTGAGEAGHGVLQLELGTEARGSGRDLFRDE